MVNRLMIVGFSIIAAENSISATKNDCFRIRLHSVIIQQKVMLEKDKLVRNIVE
jgi:hypothetical protein